MERSVATEPVRILSVRRRGPTLCRTCRLRARVVHFITSSSLEKNVLRKLGLLFLGVTIALGGAASAQQIDFGFGVGTISAPSASTVPTLNQPPVSLKGGAYPSFSGDVLLFKHYGIGGNIAWRASQAAPPGAQPYRPILWDIDGMWVPPLGKHAAAEFSAGIGVESTRFYSNIVNCSYFSCTNYTTSSHFLGQFGAGLKLYPHGGFFIKPEAHLYLVNNNVEYSSSHAVRYGGTIGYTFGGGHY